MTRDELTTHSNTTEVNISIAPDNDMTEKWATLQFHHNILSDLNVLEINSNLQLPKPVVTTVSNWLSYSGIEATSEQTKKMSKFVRGL